MSEQYPIPPNGEVLRAEHLHAQTIFTLAEAGRALRGCWGFFRPAPSGSTSAPEAANHVTIENASVVITNLALISPDGFVIRKERVSEAIPTDPARNALRLAWSLPAHMSESGGRVDVDFSIDAANELSPRSPGSVVVGRLTRDGSRPGIAVTAPSLSLDGFRQLSDAWAGVKEQLGKMVARLGRTGRGLGFERLVVRAALERARTIPGDCDPRRATWELEGAVRQLVCFAEANGAPNVVNETSRLLELVGQCRRSADEGELSDLCSSMERVSAPERLERTRSWLEPGTQVLEPAGELGGAGNQVVRRYSLGGGAEAGDVLVKVTDGTTPPFVQGRCEDERDWRTLNFWSVNDFEFHATIAVPAGATWLELQCDRRVDPEVQSRAEGE